jgi:hypothetical protein
MRNYPSPERFKQALEQRLRTAAQSGVALSRKRQLLVFDRFLARVNAVFANAMTLKGGLVLELRLQRARTTKDVDLRLDGTPDQALVKLQEAGRHPLDDFMLFEVSTDLDRPEIRGNGMRYEGMRFRAECKLAGKLYGQPFGVDVAFGDPMFGEPEVIVADDVLAFAGIAPPSLRLYPVETHLAEKLHAFTMPRLHPNTRVKDLPDLALLATVGALSARRVHAALDQTFVFRDTHPLPDAVPAPLEAWRVPYAAMARENQLPWSTLDDVTKAVKEFLDPVLTGALEEATWAPSSWQWRRS